MPGVKQLLRDLRSKGLKVGLASSSKNAKTVEILKRVFAKRAEGGRCSEEFCWSDANELSIADAADRGESQTNVVHDGANLTAPRVSQR